MWDSLVEVGAKLKAKRLSVSGICGEPHAEDEASLPAKFVGVVQPSCVIPQHKPVAEGGG